MEPKKSEVSQGKLELMILRTLHGLGPLHGFGIARRIEQLSEEVLQLNEGTVIPLCCGSSGMDGSLRSGARRKTTAKPSSTPSPGVG